MKDFKVGDEILYSGDGSHAYKFIGIIKRIQLDINMFDIIEIDTKELTMMPISWCIHNTLASRILYKR